MAIVQISKIQQRSGNLVDLPQLDQAEFGWASDQNRLFIGKNVTGANIENVEVLTSYSNIDFNQINGAVGNLDIVGPVTGQALAYDGLNDNWINTGGNALDPGNSTYWSNTPIHLGNVSNVFIGGGADGYILETDGTGNLSWTPKGSLYTVIEALSNANPMIMTVDETTPYTNGQEITISGANLTGVDVVNGNVFYVKVAVDYPTSGNVSLYTDSTLVTPADGTTIGTYTANSGIATAIIASPTLTVAAGANTQIQYNSSGILDGSPNFTFDFANSIVTVNGNANVGNLNATGILKSSIITGTPPLTVTSSTRVANLNVAHSNVSDFTAITSENTGTFYLTFANNSSAGNYTLSSNANLSFNAATGNLSSVLLTGTLTTGAQPNITSVGTLTNLTVTGNVTASNFVGILANGNSNVSIPTANGNVNISAEGNANVVVVTGNSVYINKTLQLTELLTNNITTGSNVTAGTITGAWTLTAGSTLQATYADLAEYYNADKYYEPGTVLEFGGNCEVTLALDATTRIAGVVSTDPAYAMNAKCPGLNPTPIALQGRVPCKVRGTIRKGDMMISGGNGYARPSNHPLIGSVIGKALEDFKGEGVIEIAVGRL